MKKGSVLVFILYCSFPYLTALVPSLVDTSKCIKRNGNFPKPGSFCRSYYNCRNWVPEELTCPADGHFFPEKGYCVQPEMYPCLEKPKHKECPIPNGFFLIPNTNCKEYYDCCNGVPTKKTCPADFLFNQERGICDWSELVTCPDKDQCHPNPCLNDGACNVTKGKITCSCRDPFIGGRCEKNQCLPNPCYNDGACNVDNGKMTCFCKGPFFGERCEKDQCDPNPCKNNGTCSITNEKVTCSCEDPFSGARCEKNLCELEPCENNGTCSVTNGTVTCICKDSFIGEKCEKDLCLLEPCENNGTCSVTNGAVTCICKDSFIGGKCEKDQCLPNPCFNNGRCYAKQVKITCFCDYPFGGEKCEIDIRTTPTTPLMITAHIFCPERDGHFPHPNDKYKFVVCVDGDPSVMDCPSHLVYDHEKRSCEYDLS